MKRKKPRAPRARLKGPIHSRIAALREKAQLSQEQLAEECGVDKSAVSHWENRIARPDLSRLAALANALGVTIDELLEVA